MRASTIKVLVVDDSPFMRHVISRLLNEQLGIEVVGTAPDGEACLRKVEELSPDVVTLDVEMPRLNGLDTLARLMERHPLPVVMLSAYTKDGAQATIQALELGAVDFIAKPTGPTSPNIHRIGELLVQKVRGAAGADVTHLHTSRILHAPSLEIGLASADSFPCCVVAIGCSSGGPHALHRIMPRFPSSIPASILIVQHMPSGFTTSLATRLNEVCSIPVREARPGDELVPGAALVAPGDTDVELDGSGRIQVLEGGNTAGKARPSVDIAFESVARVYGARVLGVVLTGMGSDGVKGAGCIRKLGGMVLAEDQSTCIVNGMPKRVIEEGHANLILPLYDIPTAILQIALVRKARLSAA